MTALSEKPHSFSWRGWMGLVLLAICWPLNWTLPGMRTSIFFFPLWVGYIYLMDGLVLWRRGDSLARRCGGHFIRLFLVSIPAWWIFEAMNLRTRNWEYLGVDNLADIPYFVGSSICFSTVIPAVFETAELIRSLPFFRDRPSHATPGPSRLTFFGRAGSIGLGALMVALTLLWPGAFYPLLWGGFFLVLDPINDWFGRPSLLAKVRCGEWVPAICLSLGALVCGFFWEMWNYYSFPKWVYYTPGAGTLHLFEMPLLGYLGYIPFAWELYAMSHFLWKGTPELRI